MSGHFDIIIGTGAGGGTLLNRLAPSGKRVLVLERGPFLPREKDNWNYHGSLNSGGKAGRGWASDRTSAIPWWAGWFSCSPWPACWL